MQVTQELLVKGTQVVTLMDKLRTAERDALCPKELSSSCATAVALLGNASLELCLRCRDLMHSSINKKYHALCGSATPVGKLLFGDKITEDLKEINEAAKVSRGVVHDREASSGSSRSGNPQAWSSQTRFRPLLLT